MQIADGTVVAMDYALKDDEGTLIDQSQPGQPMVYLHGHRNIIPGLEAALVGKLAGETAEVRVDPANGYGEVNPALEQVVPKDRFQGVEDLQTGMQFQANTDQGPVSVRVVKVEDDDVTVDGASDNYRVGLDSALPVTTLCQSDGAINIAFAVDLAVDHEVSTAGNQAFNLAAFADESGSTR